MQAATPDRFQMTKLVVSFNRHFFYMAIGACTAGVIVFFSTTIPWLRWTMGVGIAAAIYFMIVSVIAGYFVYDHSDLYKLHHWPAQGLTQPPGQAVLIHAGFDPTSAILQEKYPQMKLRVLDFFSPQETTEASIRHAHRTNPATGPQESCSVDKWPIDDASQDAVLAISSAHEVRDATRRVKFFREARRVLKPQGTIIVIEQLRSLPNFLCFGVAAFHFYSPRAWRRTFADAGLSIEREFSISPFMRAWVLR